VTPSFVWSCFSRCAAALLDYEQAGDLALNSCSNQDRAGFGQRLHSCCNIRRISVDLACRIDHHRAGFDADAGVERRLAKTGVFAVDLRKRALDGKGGPCCTFSVVFLRDWIAEQCHQSITQLFRYMAAHLRHCSGGGIQI
jgi:hypothetical protein